MDIRGIWESKRRFTADPDGEKVFTPDNRRRRNFEEMAAMMQWRTEFAD